MIRLLTLAAMIAWLVYIVIGFQTTVQTVPAEFKWLSTLIGQATAIIIASVCILSLLDDKK